MLCARMYEILKIWGQYRAPPLWDRCVVDTLEIRYSPRVLIPNFVALGQTVLMYIGGPKNFLGR